MLGEVGVVEHRVLGRFQRGAEALVVDLAVAGHADRQQLPFAAGLAHLEQHVLQRVGGGDLAAEPGAVGPVDQRGDGRGVGGVVHLRPRADRRSGSASGTAVITASTLAA